MTYELKIVCKDLQELEATVASLTRAVRQAKEQACKSEGVKVGVKVVEQPNPLTEVVVFALREAEKGGFVSRAKVMEFVEQTCMQYKVSQPTNYNVYKALRAAGLFDKSVRLKVNGDPWAPGTRSVKGFSTQPPNRRWKR